MISCQIITFENSLATGSTTVKINVNDSNIINDEWDEQTVEKEIIW